MIDTERKEDLFLDTKLIKSENRLGKLRIIDELHPVLGGQPTHEADQPNDNNPFLDLACTMQFTIDKVNAVDKKADTKLAKAQNLKDVANVAIARDNLGLGTSSTMNATSTLSDRTDQTATIKAVNDVNRDVVTAQKTANTANDKANVAQTRADSAYNLANSANNNANTRLEKSKNLSDLTNTTTARNNLGLGTSSTMNATSTLSDRTDQTATIKAVNDVNRAASTAQKTANNAHALAQSKQDKLTFVGDGPDVMKMGAFGIGDFFSWNASESFEDFGKKYKGLVSAYHRNLVPEDSPTSGAKKFLQLGVGGQWETQIIFEAYSNDIFIRTRKNTSGDFKKWSKLYNTDNTTVDKSGFLRAFGSANALTESDKSKILKSKNGWWTCGTTGLTYQWGYLNQSDDEYRTIIFPVSFKNASVFFTLQREHEKAATSAHQPVFIVKDSLKKESVEIKRAGDESYGFWFAVGY